MSADADLRSGTAGSSAWTLIASVLGASMVFLDSTVVNVALPKMADELPRVLFGRLEGQSYVYNGYLLTLSALLILAGAITDYYGRRRIFAIGLTGFCATSILCAASPSFEMLVVFRVLQGAAGAFLVPGSLAILTSRFQGSEQAKAIGIWSAASAATTTLGPLVGGVLVDTLSWRAAFLLNVPVFAVALYATLGHVKESWDDEAAQGGFDWRGAAVVALAIGGLAFGGVRGQESNWNAASAFVALALGAAATVAFPFLMARTRNPLVPLELFRSRRFSVINSSTLLIYGALYVFMYYQSIYLQGTLGYTAMAAGAAGLPIGISLALLSTLMGTFAGRWGARPFLTAGPLLMAAGILWFTRVPVDSVPWMASPGSLDSLVPSSGYLVDFLPGIVLMALGLSTTVAPLTSVVMSSVPGHHAGLASAINNAISRVGPQLAGTAVFVAVTASFYTGLSHRLPSLDVSSAETRAALAPLNRPAPSVRPEEVRAAREASTDAYHLAMRVAAGLLVVGALTNGAGIRPTERQA